MQRPPPTKSPLSSPQTTTSSLLPNFSKHRRRLHSSPHCSRNYQLQMRRESAGGGRGGIAVVEVEVEERRPWDLNRVGFDSYGKMVLSGGTPCVSCTTFNILAPIYKRLDKEDQSRRESDYRAYWLARNQGILDRLLEERSSIICLQELWVRNDELVQMYEKRLGDAGYASFKLARTNNRGDGLFTAVHEDYFRVLNHRELHFNDVGDRVAQLLHVESTSSFWHNDSKIRQQALVVNTHLLFPHDHTYCIIRLRQVYKILMYIESYRQEKKLDAIPIILCGDWNGSKRGQVYKFLRSQGFVSSYDTAHHSKDGELDAHKWVSHRNHRGNICGVDFIWLLNPNKHRKPLRTSWNEGIFCIIKYLLKKASLTEDEAFEFLKAGNPGDFITHSSFCQVLHKLNLTGRPHGLSLQEVEHLWIQADVDEDGLLSYLDFRRSIWNPRWAEECIEGSLPEGGSPSTRNDTADIAVGFDVKMATLFPPEVENGTWPDDYYLSDHAPLTVVFSPRAMACSQPIY